MGMDLSVSLPRYPFSHLFVPKGATPPPLMVYVRGAARVGEGVLMEIHQGISTYTPRDQSPNVHFLLGNTLVERWKPLDATDMDQTLPLLAHVAWITYLPVIHYAEPTDPYRPAPVLGWRAKFDSKAEIQGGVPNPNCFRLPPFLKAFRVVFKKQKGTISERTQPMLKTMSTIQRKWFDESDDARPDWVTTGLLAGNFRYDKKRHTTTATWLVLPQHAGELQEEIHALVPDALVDKVDLEKY